MINEELKKKIIEIIRSVDFIVDFICVSGTLGPCNLVLDYSRIADALITAGYGDTKVAAKEAVTEFQAKLTKWLAKQYRGSSTVEITAVFDKIEELLEGLNNG